MLHLLFVTGASAFLPNSAQAPNKHMKLLMDDAKIGACLVGAAEGTLKCLEDIGAAMSATESMQPLIDTCYTPCADKLAVMATCLIDQGAAEDDDETMGLALFQSLGSLCNYRKNNVPCGQILFALMDANEGPPACEDAVTALGCCAKPALEFVASLDATLAANFTCAKPDICVLPSAEVTIAVSFGFSKTLNATELDESERALCAYFRNASLSGLTGFAGSCELLPDAIVADGRRLLTVVAYTLTLEGSVKMVPGELAEILIQPMIDPDVMQTISDINGGNVTVVALPLVFASPLPPKPPSPDFSAASAAGPLAALMVAFVAVA